MSKAIVSLATERAKREGPPFPVIAPETAQHVRIPEGARVRACCREVNACVYAEPLPRYGRERVLIQIEGITAPLADDLVDAMVSLVMAIGMGNLTVPAAKQIVGLLPGAFNAQTEVQA